MYMTTRSISFGIDNSTSVIYTAPKETEDIFKFINATGTVDGSLTTTQLRSGSHATIGTPITIPVTSGLQTTYRVAGSMVSALRFQYVIATQGDASMDITYTGDPATSDTVTIFDSEGRGIYSRNNAMLVTYPTAMIDTSNNALKVDIVNAAINVDVNVSDQVVVYGTDSEGVSRPLYVNDQDNLKVTLDTSAVRIHAGDGTPIKDYNGGIYITRGALEQANYIDVSQGLSITGSSTVYVHSLSTVNMRNDSAVYLKLYDASTAPSPSVDLPKATYVLFPQKREHLTWSNGLYFSNGLGALCTLHSANTDASYVNSGDCHVHLSYTAGL